MKRSDPTARRTTTLAGQQNSLVLFWLMAVVCFSCIVPSVFADDSLRTWTDRSGKFRVLARFHGFDGQWVELRGDAGNRIRIRIDQLADSDQQFLLNLDEIAPSGQDNPFRLTAKAKRETKPQPILDLDSSGPPAPEGSLLQWSPSAISIGRASLPKPIPADRTPHPFPLPTARIQMAKADMHDRCSALIPVSWEGLTTPRLAMSANEAIGLPGQPKRSLLVSFNSQNNTGRVMWREHQPIEMCDYHVSSRRGLILIGQDPLGQGGTLSVADNWQADHISLHTQRKLSDQKQLTWAKWIDEDHVLALIDGSLVLWNLTTGGLIYRIQGYHWETTPALSGGRRIAAIARQGAVDLRRTTNGELLGTIPVENDRIPTVEFSPDGDALAIISPRHVRVWDLVRGSMRANISCRSSLGDSPPVWLDDDLLLASSGVMLSVKRRAAIWRYDMAGVQLRRVGDKIAMFRRSPETELCLVQLPHRSARNALGWMDRQSGIETDDNWTVLGRSDWQGGQWTDRNLRLSAASNSLR